jgi:hypothetical protein
MQKLTNKQLIQKQIVQSTESLAVAERAAKKYNAPSLHALAQARSRSLAILQAAEKRVKK